MINNNLLMIFVKYPTAGEVKTRLSTHLSEEQIVQVYGSMVQDLVANFKNSSEFDVQILFWPPGARHDMQNWLGDYWTYLPQTSGDLGRKMKQAFAMAFVIGYKKVIIVGSDLPTLNNQEIIEAFARLENHQAVFGPSKDGGYYLIGLQTSQPNLFNNIKWSTEKVLAQTIQNAENQQIPFTLLAEKKDIDEYPDLIELWNTLKKHEQDNYLPHTYKTLQAIFTKMN